MAARDSASGGTGAVSTQNTQYDGIGERYGAMKEMPAAEPERPSVVAVVGGVGGRRCLGAFFSCLWWC